MFNTGDVFIVDTGKIIYQWNGKASSGVERVKAAEYAHGIAADRAGAVRVDTIGNVSSFPPFPLVPLGLWTVEERERV